MGRCPQSYANVMQFYVRDGCSISFVIDFGSAEAERLQIAVSRKNQAHCKAEKPFCAHQIEKTF